MVRPQIGSISWTGNCYDNSVTGCFFDNLKPRQATLGGSGPCNKPASRQLEMLLPL
ncbi:MAG: hypothetical protein K2O58_05715 [Bacteroidales bacterium]|nr:hypothetical protein [Bacteroidales bacterium]